MDIKTKCEINSKLDYEGGYEYLVHGNSFEGADPRFDKLVQRLSEAWNDVARFLEVEEDCPEEDEDA